MRRSLFLFVLACGSSGSSTVADFDLHADLTNPDSYWSMPYPSDLRLTPQGTPDVRGFPNNLNEVIIEGLRTTAMQRVGFPQMPSAYFHFDAAIPPQDPNNVIAADKASPILLVDVDPTSPARGALFPVVAGTPPPDRYVLDNTLEMAPRVGIVLEPKRTYAFVVMKSLHDATNAPLGARDAFTALESATAPAADPELAAWKNYQPLWATLDQIGVARTDVAVATVFTTGDVVQDTADLSSKVIAQYQTSITDLAVPAVGDHSRFCELLGKISYPQFQEGTPPFDSDGLFQMGTDGLPIKQRDEIAPIAISLPKGEMPAGGYPFIVYFHGSGGLSTAVIDAGPLQSATDEVGTPGEGPAYVMAPHGFAMAGSALPLNPERVPGATELEYLNFNNPASFRDTFRQGIIEQRMFIDALSKLTIDLTTVATSCTGMSLIAGETAFHFNMTPLHAQGQSMGGMYTNLIGATDPRVKVVVPTGAGGYWSFMVLTTQTIPNAPNDLKLLLGTGDLTFMHPALHLLETAWEAAEPFVYMTRVQTNPLPGHTARPVYDPVGLGDTYFSAQVYDGVSLAYGHKEAGDIVWPTMQTALALHKLDGIAAYPVVKDGAIVQYNGDGMADPHAIYRQLDAVKYQYACFHESFQKTGTATLYAPQPIDSPCGP